MEGSLRETRSPGLWRALVSPVRPPSPQESLFCSSSIREMLCSGAAAAERALRATETWGCPHQIGRGRKNSWGQKIWLLVSGSAIWAMSPVQCRLILSFLEFLGSIGDSDTSMKVAALCVFKAEANTWDLKALTHYIHQNLHLSGSGASPVEPRG